MWGFLVNSYLNIDFSKQFFIYIFFLSVIKRRPAPTGHGAYPGPTVWSECQPSETEVHLANHPQYNNSTLVGGALSLTLPDSWPDHGTLTTPSPSWGIQVLPHLCPYRCTRLGRHTGPFPGPILQYTIESEITLVKSAPINPNLLHLYIHSTYMLRLWYIDKHIGTRYNKLQCTCITPINYIM